MTVSTFVPTAAGNQSVNSYTGAIDGDFAVLTRLSVAFAPHAQAVPNMTVALAAGHIFNGTDLTEVPPQTTAAIVAPTTDPRIDRVVIDRLTGVVSVVTGAESATPVAPAFPAGKVPVARVLLQPGMTVVTNDAVTDERSLYSLGSSGSTGAGGGLINVQVFSTPGTYTYTPTAGTNKIIVEVQGGGGAGGEAVSNGDDGVGAVGSGGCAGSYAKSFLASGFSGATVIVGAGGASSRVPGALSKFGTITAPGGDGGVGASRANVPQYVQPSRFPSGPATGGNLVNSTGAQGGRGLLLLSESTTGRNMDGGYGASSQFGAGGKGGNVNGDYTGDAGSPGAGGGGATASDTTVVNGGKGGDGIVIVYEYA